jgi:hypothetical protein
MTLPQLVAAAKTRFESHFIRVLILLKSYHFCLAVETLGNQASNNNNTYRFAKWFMCTPSGLKRKYCL